jgi:uncharacterized protein
MNYSFKRIINSCLPVFLLLLSFVSLAQDKKSAPFRIIAFYTAKNDLAHIDFVKEAHQWFRQQGEKYNFQYDSTNNWNNLNLPYLSQYKLVVFLDTRPEDSVQRTAFQQYMENGGAWIGFHFSAFALNNSAFPQTWDWYHNHFLGSGEYGSNTWRPTSAILKVEDRKHSVTKGLPAKITAAPNEWYRWKNDLRKNRDVRILLSIDPSSFPLGTGPKPHEIWHEGYYPVVWTNTRYRMVYFNMGHNDMDYEGKTNKPLSSTFSSENQNRLLINSIIWLGRSK